MSASVDMVDVCVLGAGLSGALGRLWFVWLQAFNLLTLE